MPAARSGGAAPAPAPDTAGPGARPRRLRQLRRARRRGDGAALRPRRPNAVVIATTASVAARWLVPRLPHLAAAEQVAGARGVGADRAGAGRSGRPGGRSRPSVWVAARGPTRMPKPADGRRPLTRSWRPDRRPDTGDRPGQAVRRQPCRCCTTADPRRPWAAWFATHPVPGVDIPPRAALRILRPGAAGGGRPRRGSASRLAQASPRRGVGRRGCAGPALRAGGGCGGAGPTGWSCRRWRRGGRR